MTVAEMSSPRDTGGALPLTPEAVARHIRLHLERVEYFLRLLQTAQAEGHLHKRGYVVAFAEALGSLRDAMQALGRWRGMEEASRARTREEGQPHA